MKRIIEKNLSGKNIAILFLLTNLVYAVMLIITIPKVMEFSGGMKLLDMMPLGYDAEYVTELFNVLGEKGRTFYLYRQIPVDMVYPVLFGLSYSLILAYFLNKLNKLNSLLYYLCLLPVIAGISDYMENIGILTMLYSYPNLSQYLIESTNIFSIVKSMSTTIYFVVLIVVFIVLGIKTINKKKSGADNV